MLNDKLSSATEMLPYNLSLTTLKFIVENCNRVNLWNHQKTTCR